MSTPQTLAHVPSLRLAHPHAPFILSPHDRYLPPPRPSSNPAGSHPAVRSLPYVSNAVYLPRDGTDYAGSNTVASPHAAMSPAQASAGAVDDRRRAKPAVDWVQFFGGQPPREIITIHDDDSPCPEQPPEPAVPHHADKRRRTNGNAAYSTTHTPYSYNGSSAATPATMANRHETAQTGQKRKRITRESERERKRVEAAHSSATGYLAQYGDYIPPPRLPKKQREVYVPVIAARSKPNEPVDDEEGHYIVHERSTIGGKFTIVKLLGQGTFGKVVEAVDSRTRDKVAIKIIRSVQKYRDASRIELRVLQTIRAADEHNRNRCIQLRECFDYRGHICIVTPLLGLSVFDFLKQGGFVPFPGSHIQAFARQLLGSIAFLHDLNLIHTDLKPENILLLSHEYQAFTYNRNIPSSSTLSNRSAKFRRVLMSPHINLIDFGSATFDDEYHSSVVSTRHYRAPEIIMGIGWTFPIDLWSLGCILVECWTGDALFQTHDCYEHLAMMEAVIGEPIDRSLIRQVNRGGRRADANSAARFFKNGQLSYPAAETPKQSKKYVRAMKRLEEIIPPTSTFNTLFLDLLRRIFVFDPKRRITAREALKHPWFQELVQDDGTEASRIKYERDHLAERSRGRR